MAELFIGFKDEEESIHVATSWEFKKRYKAEKIACGIAKDLDKKLRVTEPGAKRTMLFLTTMKKVDDK